MGNTADISEPVNELERLITDLSASGPPAGQRWWHAEPGGAASWVMDVRVDEITAVRFVREPNPFPSFPGREVLTVQFTGPAGQTALYYYLHDLYDGQRIRPGKLAPWQAPR